jgi:flagellar biosynthesis/type III secretory pathway protein FliH
MNTKEQWEYEFDKRLKLYSFEENSLTEECCENGDKISESKIIDFIRETREQAYQKGLDDGYSDGFRACEQGVTP